MENDLPPKRKRIFLVENQSNEVKEPNEKALTSCHRIHFDLNTEYLLKALCKRQKITKSEFLSLLIKQAAQAENIEIMFRA